MLHRTPIKILLFLCGSIFFTVSCGLVYPAENANSAPAIERHLNAAIIRDAEKDTEQEERENDEQLKLLWANLTSALQQAPDDRASTTTARGKFHKRRKMLKYLYPLAVGIIIAKSVLIPLLLKLLTAMSTSSFVMSKIAMLFAGVLLLKWLFVGGPPGRIGFGDTEHKHFRIVHGGPAIKAYHNDGDGPVDWHDLYTDATSNWIDTRTQDVSQYYMPLKGKPNDANGGVGGGVGVVSSTKFPGGVYTYSTSSYDKKPFL